MDNVEIFVNDRDSPLELLFNFIDSRRVLVVEGSCLVSVIQHGITSWLFKRVVLNFDPAISLRLDRGVLVLQEDVGQEGCSVLPLADALGFLQLRNA